MFPENLSQQLPQHSYGEKFIAVIFIFHCSKQVRDDLTAGSACQIQNIDLGLRRKEPGIFLLKQSSVIFDKMVQIKYQTFIDAVWGFNGTERPGAVYLAAVMAAHAQRGLPAFSIYGHDVQDAKDTTIPADVLEKILRFARRAVAGGFQGQRQWTDWLPNADFTEAILASTFDWNGPKAPTPFATENDTCNGISMLLGHLISGTAPCFHDVRTYWSPEACERVTGQKPDGVAANGFIHLINSGATALDGTRACVDEQGDHVMKPFWKMTEEDLPTGAGQIMNISGVVDIPATFGVLHRCL